MERRTFVIACVLFLIATAAAVVAVLPMQMPSVPRPAPSAAEAPTTGEVRQHAVFAVERIEVAVPQASPRSESTIDGSQETVPATLGSFVWHIRPRSDLPSFEHLVAEAAFDDAARRSITMSVSK
jgi:hypothetical protein